MKLFQKVKEIRSRKGDLHFERWAILETDVFAVYIHRIHIEDRDLHLHSHPWNFISWILKGSYDEENQSGINNKRFLSFSKADTNYVHKIKRITNGPVYSLFITYGKKKPWYYLVNSELIESETYRKIKNDKREKDD